MRPADSDVPLSESPQRWILLVLLTAAMFICYMHRAAVSVAAPFLIQDLGLNKNDMGMLLSAFFWSYSIFQIPAGWLTDRFGVVWAYAGGFALWALAAAGTGLATGLSTLIAFRMLLGVGQAVAFPASARAVANWFPDRNRGFVTSVYLSGVRLGQALITAVGGVVLAKYPWRWYFIIPGLLALIWIVPWVAFLRPWEKKTAAQTPKSNAGMNLGEMLSLFRERKILGIFLGFFAYDYVWFLFLTWLPGYLMLERKFTPAEMAVYSSVPLLYMFGIILLAGIVSDFFIRKGFPEVRVRKWMITVGFLISLIMVPAAFTDDKRTAAILLGIAMCGLGIVAPNSWTLTQAVCEKRIVGTASGIQNFGGNIGGVIAPWLTGYIAHVTNSFALAFCIAGAISVSGILFYWFLIPSQGVVREKQKIKAA
ncbi:MAG TPA: MFS transporter [Bryobacteraceae bacterium]|jgi:MFS family permease|nr:MFS transporter [Bryobacteraceae bacterium]